MIFAICFTNFGPYHLARLRALASRLRERGDCLIAYEMAATERTYPWQRPKQAEPFDWITFFPDRVLETLTAPTAPRRLSGHSTAISPMPWGSSAMPGRSRWPRPDGSAETAKRRS